ncbi:PadR family transcriptional regulator [Micromonospora siamensis]|uniref:DNA-binding transcriptional regulator, PadR family n=1 Tax=Micromonospora siamensis TaxID=299152 RepID=A0A1C5J0Y3_9ACTN|nr:PadR family transcriptional regulator [Micromonospora siamensis]SCG64252.1 DNA-binding transcriptional regulator, PadR family [Micromonospora siamensis]
MSLEHAILVSLLEQPASGYELARRFDRSIGRFWTATHQQIYRVLRRMEADAWIVAEQVGQAGVPDKKVWSATAAGRATLVTWLRAPVEPEAVRHELAVKIRGAAFDDPEGRAALRAEVERYRADHEAVLAGYLAGERRDFPEGATADARSALQHVVLRGGIAYERMVLAWLDDVLATLHDLDR